MSSAKEIKAMPDEEKPFIKTAEIINSVLSSEKLLPAFKHTAIKIIAKEYNKLKGKPIMSTMGGAGTMRTELQMLWCENKNKFQEELLNLVENHNELKPIHMIAKDKWPLYYNLKPNLISIDKPEVVGLNLNQELAEIENGGENGNEMLDKMMKEMMKQSANILSVIESVKTEVTSCAKREDLTQLATCEQLEAKIQESEKRSRAEFLDLLEKQPAVTQTFTKEETMKMIAEAIESKFSTFHTGQTREVSQDEIFAAATRDMLEAKKYRAEVIRNKKEGRLQLVLKNTDEMKPFREQDIRTVRCGYELDFQVIEQLIGAKFEVIPQNKVSLSEKGNLILQILVIHPFKKMIQKIHSMVRDNYGCKNAFISIKTPEIYDMAKILSKWRVRKIIVDFENRSFGFLQLLVNDGDQSLIGTNEYKKTCSIFYVQNPESILRLNPVTREKLRILADNQHFIMENEIRKRPDELQTHFNGKFTLRISKHPITDL